MPLNFYMWCALAGILGILFHVMTKMNALKISSKAANKNFSVKQYLHDDWITIVSSFVVIAILIVLLDEILRFQPAVRDYIKFSFVFVGYTGSSILQHIMGKTSKKLLALIDVKSNVSDAMTGGTQGVQETIDKGSEATGVAITADIKNETITKP